jgi:hypothetical protein
MTRLDGCGMLATNPIGFKLILGISYHRQRHGMKWMMFSQKSGKSSRGKARAWFDKLTMTWLTMTGMEPALSLPKGRRKLERSIWTFYVLPSRYAFL